MAFEYYGLPQGGQQQQVDYTIAQPQQQQQGQSMNPMQGLSMYQQFSGEGGMFGSGGSGGGAAAGGGTAGGGGAAVGGGAGAGTGATAGGGSAAGSGGSALGSAGPWAALAAVIIGNEREGMRQGYRDEDPEDYAKDLFGGKVMEQDMEKRWLPKFGKDEYGIGADQKISADMGTGDFSNAWSVFKDDSSAAVMMDKLFGLKL